MNFNNLSDESLWEAILRYVNLELKEEETIEFKRELEQNPELKEKVLMAEAMALQEQSPDNIDAIGDSLEEEFEFWDDVKFVAQNGTLIDAMEIAEGLPLPQLEPVPSANTASTVAEAASQASMFSIRGIGIAAVVVILLVGAIVFLPKVFSKPDQSNFDFILKLPLYESPFLKDSQGMAFLKDGKYEDAIRDFKDELNIIQNQRYPEENNIKPHYLKLFLAIAYLKLNEPNPNEVLKFLKEIEDNTDILDAPQKLYLGLFYYGKNDYNQARDYLEEVKDKKGIHHLEPDGKSVSIGQIAREYLLKIEDERNRES